MPLKILRLDFESFFCSEDGYSLKSQTMNTSEYIRDSLFRAHGISAGFEGEPIEWITHDDLPRYFKQVPWEETAMLCWNTPFDGLILYHHYGCIPAFYLDGQRMAQILYPRTIRVGLDAVSQMHGLGGKLKGVLDDIDGVKFLTPEQEVKVGEYAIVDSEIMWENFRIMEDSIPADELRLIDMTTLMFAVPVAKINKTLVREEIQRLEILRREMFGRLAFKHDCDNQEEVLKMLNSSAQLAKALRNVGREPPMKKNDKGARIYAFAKTDAGFQALHHDPKVEVRELIEGRLEAKGGTTQLGKAIRFLDNADPALPIGLDYGKPRTLRWSGTNKMNPQNLERGGLLRQAIEAPPGYNMNVVDSSQIEDRMNCWLSGQEDVLDEYRTGGDPYKLMASGIYGVPAEEITKAQRFVGKVARLQLGYQAGKETFHRSLVSGALGPPIDIEREDADYAHTVYRTNNRQIVGFWRFLRERIRAMMEKEYREDYVVDGKPIFKFCNDEIELPNGLSMHYLDLRYTQDTEEGDTPWEADARPTHITYQSSPNGRSKIYEGKICENINQALAKIVVADQILKIAERYRVVSTTHDELWYLSPKREGLSALEFGIRAFNVSRGWYSEIPLGAEGGQAKTYEDAKSGDMSLKDFT